MDDEIIEQIRQQHVDNYRNGILDIIDNNSKALVEDIQTLIKKPPLEAMDIIKTKFLSLAKKHKIILNTIELDNILDEFRGHLFEVSTEIGKMRVKSLNDIVNNTKLDDNNVIKINKKHFVDINKEMKKKFKTEFSSAIDKFSDSVIIVFNSDLDDKIKEEIVKDLIKYIKGNYFKQLLDNFDIKILVKDTTLINSVKEQSERYLFTLNNSRVLNDLDN